MHAVGVDLVADVGDGGADGAELARLDFDGDLPKRDEGEDQFVLVGAEDLLRFGGTPVVGDDLLFFAAWSPGKSDSPFPSWKAFLEMNDKNKDGEVALDEMSPSDRDFGRAPINRIGSAVILDRTVAPDREIAGWRHEAAADIAE